MTDTSGAKALWDELLSAAIVGIDRRQPRLSAAGGPLAALVNGPEPATPERQALRAAAALGLYRLAGRAAEIAPPWPPPCPAEEAPECSGTAAARLERMLAGEHEALLPEWLRVAGEAGLRAPAWLLPALLDLGANESARREAVAAVAGRRGRWLAERNDAWRWLKERDPAEVWRNGSHAERLEALAALRRRDPAAGRALLRQTWAQERVDDRVRLIGALAVGLSVDDEPFLEPALDDRSPVVRYHAADLLAKLPESRFCARMFERARQYLRFDPGPRASIAVELPETLDAEARRDGLDRATVASVQFGASGDRLHSMIARVPPARWCTLWNAAPDRLIAALRSSEPRSRQLITDAWLAATRGFADANWAAAFDAAAPLDLPAGRPRPVLPTLWLVDQARGRAGLLAFLRSDAGDGIVHSDPLVYLADAAEALDRELSIAVLELARRSVQVKTTPDAAWASWLPEKLAATIDPALAEAAARGWPEDAPQWLRWQPVVARLIDTLVVRREMLAELRPHPDEPPPTTDEGAPR
ncbi:MAG TPA: DUF5691 domain-containing protein [Dehalococcoidia bacterium]|nr:DUF5691 domain-containing protein [Dehalococcoidia bacterium]